MSNTHKILECLSRELVKQNVVKMNYETGGYYFNPDVRELVSTSLEVLKNPVENTQQQNMLNTPKITDISVALLRHSGSDTSIAEAARVSLNHKVDQYSEEKNKHLLTYLATHNHWTPFAHTFLSFHVKAPIFVARQLAKHQVGLVWNEISRRYVDTSPEYYIPTEFRERAPNIKQGSKSEVIPNNEEMYADFKQLVCEINAFYKYLLNFNVAPELARTILPVCMQTEWIWSGSLYAFARAYNLRKDAHAQVETREVMLQLAKQIPPTFEHSWICLTYNDKQ